MNQIQNPNLLVQKSETPNKSVGFEEENKEEDEEVIPVEFTE